MRQLICGSRLLAPILAVAGVACVAPPHDTTDPIELGMCGTVTQVPIVDSPHVPFDTPVDWTSNPPTSGPHYPVWAAWDRTYTTLDRRYWLHNAEHGAIVLAYRCDDGCPDLVDGLVAFVRSMASDPHCDAPLWTRSLVVADPLLPTDHTIAAVAWGTFYSATCVDPEALATFTAESYGRSTENTCAEGNGLGGVPIVKDPP